MHWYSLVLFAIVCIATSTADSSFLRTDNGLRRQLADDEAACIASTKASPFAEYLNGLPAIGGLQNCIVSNFGDIVTALAADGAKCTLPNLVQLFSSTTPNPGMVAFSQLISVLLGDAENTTVSVESVLSSWNSNSTVNKAFCSTMNDQIVPCIGTLLPVIVSLLDKKAPCCSGLAASYEVVKLVGQSFTQTVFNIINGLQQTMCTSLADNSYCGQRILGFLSTSVKKNGDTSLLAPLLFSAGIPLFVLPDTNFCSALESGTVPSRINSKTSVKYPPLSCCASGLGSLIQSIDTMMTQATGNTFAEMFNVMAGIQDQKKENQFQAPYTLLGTCSFKEKCSPPPSLLPASPSPNKNTLAADTNPKNKRAQGIRCESVELCDKDKVCSTVCKQGTVKMAPWVERALSYQRNLSYTDAFCYTQLPGAHNAATNFARGYGNRDQLINALLDPTNADSYIRTNNQFLTLTDQLNMGVRFLEVDVHYFGRRFRSGHCSRLNVGFLDVLSKVLIRELEGVSASSIEWQSSLMGCLPSLSGIRAEDQRGHEETLVEIGTWIENHPNDFLMLYSDLGQEIAKFEKIDALKTMYTEKLGKYLILPSAFQRNVSLSDLMTTTKKRVVLISSGGTSVLESLMIPIDTVCSGWTDIPSGTLPTPRKVGTIWGTPTNTGSIVRAYHSALHYATLSEQSLSGEGGATGGTDAEPNDVTALTLGAFVNAGVNILHPDGVDGTTMAALIWSWAENQPPVGATAVELRVNSSGRWYGVERKESIKNIACVSKTNRLQWKIVPQGDSCPSDFVQGAPMKAIENVALYQTLKETKGNEATVQLAVDLNGFPVLDAKDVPFFYGDTKNVEQGSDKNNLKNNSFQNQMKGWNLFLISGWTFWMLRTVLC